MWLVLGCLLLALVCAACCFLCVGLVDMRICQRRLAAVKNREAYWAPQIRFYHLQPTQMYRPEKSGDAVCRRMLADLRSGREFRYAFRGHEVRSGLPEIDGSGGLVIWHVGGAWSGLLPDWPELNRRLNGHAMPIRDTVSRYSFLALPYPVVSFCMPTDAVSALNFGGVDDCATLSAAYETLTKHVGKIVVSTDCLGGLRFLRWINSYPKSTDAIVGVVAEGPLPTMRRIYQPGNNPLIHSLISALWHLVLPNFKEEDKDLKMRCAKPALVTFLEKDGLCGRRDLEWISHTFTRLHTVLSVQDGAKSQEGRAVTHGNAYRFPPFRQALAKFIQDILGNPNPCPCAK